MRETGGGNGIVREGRRSRSRRIKAPRPDAGLTSIKGEERRKLV